MDFRRCLALLVLLTLMGCGAVRAGGNSNEMPPSLQGFRLLLELKEQRGIVRSQSQPALPDITKVLKASVPLGYNGQLSIKIWPRSPGAKQWVKKLQSARYVLGSVSAPAKVSANGGITVPVPLQGWTSTTPRRLQVIANGPKDPRLIADVTLVPFSAEDADVARAGTQMLHVVGEGFPCGHIAASELSRQMPSVEEVAVPVWARWRVLALDKDRNGNTRERIGYSSLQPVVVGDVVLVAQGELYTILRSIGGDVEKLKIPFEMGIELETGTPSEVIIEELTASSGVP